jgi:hypothetical protein
MRITGELRWIVFPAEKAVKQGALWVMMPAERG